MRLVLAVLRPSQVESVRQALVAVDVTRLTICDAQGCGGPDGLVQRAVLEIAVNDDFVDRTMQAIATVLAAGGEPVDGRVFSLPMTEAVQIYREVRGPEAV
ncbi:MAG: P-II family nitrogen regulator [Planctomycetota bacterium]